MARSKPTTVVSFNGDSSRTRVWLILFLGVVMTGFGITYAAATAPKSGQGPSLLNDVISGLLTAVGGGIVGATISLLVTGSSDRDTLQKIRSVVEDSLQSTLISEESSLIPVRRRWHHYFVTTIDERNVWQYERYDFDLSLTVGSVVIAITVESTAGLKIKYQVEAGVRGDRLIILSTMIGGDEPVFTEIYPQFLDFKSEHFGIVLMQNWDGFNTLTKAILSRTELFEAAEGTVAEEHFAMLEAKWERGFARHNVVFPQTQVPAQSHTESPRPKE